ncbi:DUF3560 domain-containing protein [Streptomyces sp. NRRL S-350]|uniref:DUF3560 domain-containing protein n=1 Tax=Streptomyces sp. NRRL S-350 TaxID=1463902 RepID=UPI0004BE57B6|nr:DUF3560 domain-containing protein [Streptomyces sp. NRRL S-350]
MITIRHTPAEGTTIKGTTRGDGTADLITRSGTSKPRFRLTRDQTLWYLPRSRSGPANQELIDHVAAALIEAGHEVTVEVSNERPTFAEAEAARVEAAQGRAERFTRYAEGAAVRAEDAWQRSVALRRSLGDEPVKLWHRSATKHLKDIDRAHQLHGKSIQEDAKEAHWDRRADAAAHYEQHRRNPGRTLRRIARLEALLRLYERRQAVQAQQPTPDDAELAAQAAEGREKTARLIADTVEELTFWRDVIARAEAGGTKVWSAADFTSGDYALHGKRWFKVLHANAKTITVPRRYDLRPEDEVVEPTETSGKGRLPYDDLSGRMSAAAMAAKLAADRSGATSAQ